MTQLVNLETAGLLQTKVISHGISFSQTRRSSDFETLLLKSALSINNLGREFKTW